MICAICGKKQGSMFNSYCLSKDLKDIKICGKCYEQLQKTKSSVRYDCKEAILYFSPYLTTIEDTHAKIYISQILDNCKHQSGIKDEDLEQKPVPSLPMTNGFNFEGKIITKYLKVITSEYVIGTGLVSEVKASFSDVFGVENEAFKKKMQCARDYVTADLINEAVNLGADAIIGVNFTYTTFSGNLIAVIINGTAVNTKPCPPLE